MNIIPRVNEKVKIKYPYMFNDLYLSARTSFYKSNHPEYINIDKMMTTYNELAENNGFLISDYFSIRRHFVYYLMLKLKSSGI